MDLVLDTRKEFSISIWERAKGKRKRNNHIVWNLHIPVFGQKQLELCWRKLWRTPHEHPDTRKVFGCPCLWLIHDLDDATHFCHGPFWWPLHQQQQLQHLRDVHLRRACHCQREVLQVPVLRKSSLLHQHPKTLQLIENRLVTSFHTLELLLHDVQIRLEKLNLHQLQR